MSYFFFQAEDGIRDHCVTGVQTCALPISSSPAKPQPPKSFSKKYQTSTLCSLPSAVADCSAEPASAQKAFERTLDRKSTRLNSSHTVISYAVFCLKKKKKKK